MGDSHTFLTLRKTLFIEVCRSFNDTEETAIFEKEAHDQLCQTLYLRRENSQGLWGHDSCRETINLIKDVQRVVDEPDLKPSRRG